MSAWPFWTVVVGLMAILAWVLWRPEPMLAPGPVIEGHSAIAGDCFACHRPFLGSPSEKCAACHEPARIGRFTTTGVPLGEGKAGFHQELLEQDCTACHLDHAGADARRAVRAFSHELLRPEIRERCRSCHRRPDDEVHRVLRGPCATCHSATAWTPVTFDHRDHFVLDRDHDVACTTCHRDDAGQPYTCYGCHEHTPDRIRRQHLEEGIRDYASCVECHRSAEEPDMNRPASRAP